MIQGPKGLQTLTIQGVLIDKSHVLVAEIVETTQIHVPLTLQVTIVPDTIVPELSPQNNYPGKIAVTPW